MRPSWALVGALATNRTYRGVAEEAKPEWRVPKYGAQPGPDYMVDNTDNYYGVAPDKGSKSGPVWAESGTFERFMADSRAEAPDVPVAVVNHTFIDVDGNTTVMEMESELFRLADNGWWLPELSGLGKQPIVGGDYKFFRNVKDYGATGGGEKDDTEAINAAIEDGNRCGNTFSQGAIIYFPPGVYKICTPIIQLYFTQFFGNPHDLPVIKGCDKFKGIALIDTDPYIEDGNGANWYINQNQFFRGIRHMRFDMTEMPKETNDQDQDLVPTGIHWQVSQACSLQNLIFEMPEATDDEKPTHVGIFMENGSGGFVSDLVFKGGNIGWRAGSQQYTVINLKFENCLTAIQMIWDWGFNWQRVQIDGAAIGFNISGAGGIDGQGVGSVSIIDSTLRNVETAILTNSGPTSPNIVIDNLEMSGVGATVKDTDGNVILGSSGHVELWAIGKRYNGYEGTSTAGAVDAPARPESLLDDDGKLFYRSKPQYEDFAVGQFRIATEHGCRNDGTGDNTNSINTFLREAQAAGQIAYFPAGIYRVGGTVLIPTGSRVVGAAWSQIQGAGAYFSDIRNPRVVVQVGIKGDVGTMEITDMKFNVQGATAGAIVLEWNVKAVRKGAAAMWDSHVRVGGATGSDLDVDTCPKHEFNEGCICAALLFHVTPQANGYFENVWIWLADHDNDMVVSDSPDKLVNQISIYAARGTLIESEGPSWFYGTGSEHTVMYQYQLYGAKDIYLGHIQTETPYYQPVPVAPLPFKDGREFPGDPSFESCTTIGCQEAWGLRVINSENVLLHGAGMYSFFQEYYQDCLDTFDCQERLCEVKGSKGVTIFNIFTVATVEIGTGINGGAIMQEDGNQRGFTTEISVWIPLEGDDEFDVVYVGPEVWQTPAVTCPAPCVLVFPTSSLSSSTTISPPPYTTSVEYGHMDTTTIDGQVVTTFVTTITTITITVDPISTDGMPYSNVNITQGQTSSALTVHPSLSIPPVPVPLPDGEGGTTTRTLQLPPWPDMTSGPPESWGNGPGETSGTVSGEFRTPYVTTVSASAATVLTLSFPSFVTASPVSCPPQSEIVFATPRTTITTLCAESTIISLRFTCPPTRVVTFLAPSTAVFTADCALATSFVNTPPAEGDDDLDVDAPDPTDPDRPPTVTEPLPTWTEYPPGQIETVEEDVEEDDDDDDGIGFLTPCNLWFFNICITFPGIRIGGIRWILPPGVYPGPRPPPVRLPTPWILPPPPISFPPITVGRDGRVTYSKSGECETATASICSTSITVSLSPGPTTTRTVTSTLSSCEEIRGCGVRDSDATTTTTTSPDSCPLPTQDAKKREEPGRAVASDESAEEEALERRQVEPLPPPGCPDVAIIYPADNEDVGGIVRILDEAGFTEGSDTRQYRQIGSTQSQFTLYFWVSFLDAETKKALEDSGTVEHCYYPRQWNAGVGPWDPFEGFEDESFHEEGFQDGSPGMASHPHHLPRHIPEDASEYTVLTTVNSSRTVVEDDGTPTVLKARAPTTDADAKIYHLAQVSLPPQTVWKQPGTGVRTAGQWNYRLDDVNVGNANQWVYVIGETGYWNAHAEHTGIGQDRLSTLYPPGPNYGVDPMTLNPADPRFKHGSAVVASINGNVLGLCKTCRVRTVPAGGAYAMNMPVNRRGDRLAERVLQQLTAVYDEIMANPTRKGRAVINMSWGIQVGQMPRPFFTTWFKMLRKLDQECQVVLVAAAGNDATGPGQAPDKYPQRFADPTDIFGHLPNLVVVGATDANIVRAAYSFEAPWLTTFGPGTVYAPELNIMSPYIYRHGTSFAAPQVAGLVAYYRAMPSPWQADLTEPANVKKLIRLFHRRLAAVPEKDANGNPIPVRDRSCLRTDDYNDLTWPGRNLCPTINDLSTQADTGQTVDPCGPGVGGNPTRRRRTYVKRQDGGSCPLIPDPPPGSGSGGGGGNGQTVSFTSGPQPSPTCSAAGGCGGTLCKGFWCNPRPTGVPPDYHDPKDPNSSGASASTKTISDPPEGTFEPSPPSSTSVVPTTTSGPTTTQAPPPPANPPSRFIIIVFSELSIPVQMGPWDYDRNWVVFSAAPDGPGIDMCFDKAHESVEDDGVTASDPGFPRDIEFDMDGRGCKYTGTRSALGSMACDGVRDIRCREEDFKDFCPPLNNPTMVSRVLCEW
ncbi:putative glucan 1, 3-beta-glucosidase [Colletotrichum karsti]|uniref:Glucan 1, 3-beta-glucosidase n=1 Tax=Colletotrichum karsti TaxID=1095194 RepID=A0A9P6LE11_9PEZI|nr:putative glucan 1, 3-beta-glucosidase [Colletotrichum karsti]KAF9872609.1 putative glucan 1, 3-beta-glucosidase [Colletotrichum karsti]